MEEQRPLDVPSATSVLGLEVSHRPLGMAEEISAGLPVAALDRLVGLLTRDDSGLAFRFVPKATLTRRRAGDRLSAEESARVARVAAVYAKALEVWRDPEDARDFLYRKHPMLEGRRPLDVALETDVGARFIEKILGRGLHGTAA